MKRMIVGYDRNRAIGANGTLPWEGQLKSDMRHVRQLTTGNAIIMGRKTFDSIGRALPKRQNIVITHRPFEMDGVTVVDNLDDAYAAVEDARDAFIFGGSHIYELALPTVEQIDATEIDARVDDADVFFPELGTEWLEVSREHHDADDANKYPFDFVTYRRKP